MPNQDDNVELQYSKAITRGYLLAVVIIALLATGAYISLQKALKDSESTALVVNISGKQRMLSQRIALHSHQIAYHQQNQDTPLLYTTKEVLSADIEEMQQANIKLSSGRLAENKFTPLSEDVSNLYFGDLNLFERVQQYTQLARQIVDTENTEQQSRLLKKMGTLYNPLLVDLNKVVTQYQKEGEQRLEFLKRLETLIFVATLLALLLEVLFIFRPLAKRVAIGSHLEKTFRKQLHDQVELRTLKLEQANQQLTKLAAYDALTEVKNRLTFEQDMESLLTAYKQNQQEFAVVITDLDWFKHINDEYGHDFGDNVLKEFAKLLRKHIREGDEVYRIGGEEFVILISRIEFTELLLKLEKLRGVVEKYPFVHEDKPVHITSSFGIYHSSLFHISSYKEALKLADNALYEAKSFGRNRINFAKRQVSAAENPVTENKIFIRFKDCALTKVLAIEADKDCLFSHLQTDLLSGTLQFADLVYEKDQDQLMAIQQAMQKTDHLVKTLRLKTADDAIVIVRIELQRQNNEVEVTLFNAVDLANKVNDDVLVRNFHAMLENTNDYIYFKDRNHLFTAASQTLVSLTNVASREALIGKTDYQVFSKELADEYFILEKEVFNGEVEVSQRYQPTEDVDGNKGWVDNRKYPIKNFQGEVVGLFGIARRLSAAEYEKALLAQAGNSHRLKE